MLTHHNILNNAYFSAQAMHFTERDRLCVPVPFYHCFGMVLANLLCLSVGACVVIAGEHFDAPAVLHAVERLGKTAEELPVDGGGGPVGEVLTETAMQAGCDLFVMGAYGHSRLREFMLGGATRWVLQSSPLPALLCH